MLLALVGFWISGFNKLPFLPLPSLLPVHLPSIAATTPGPTTPIRYLLLLSELKEAASLAPAVANYNTLEPQFAVSAWSACSQLVYTAPYSQLDLAKSASPFLVQF